MAEAEVLAAATAEYPKEGTAKDVAAWVQKWSKAGYKNLCKIMMAQYPSSDLIL